MQSSTLHASPVHFLIQGQANYTFTSTKEKRRIPDPLNCKSKNLSYLTECKKCGKQYIGETKHHLHQRFGSIVSPFSTMATSLILLLSPSILIKPNRNIGQIFSAKIDICIDNIDFRMVSLIPRYTLCLLRL